MRLRADAHAMNRRNDQSKARGLHALPKAAPPQDAASPSSAYSASTNGASDPGAPADEVQQAARPLLRGVYHISIVAELVETHPQTLRMYERMGLVSPQRTRNNIRLYSEADVERVRRIQHLTQDLGVNLAGVEVVFKLLNEMEKMQAEAEAKHLSLSQEMQHLREQLSALFGDGRAGGERNGRA